eukprot:SM000014S00249  [mRNA]  locus=s14:266321:267539:+ [translate_table: standard]
MARFAVAVLVLAFAASAFAACSPSGSTYFGGATSVQALENQVLSTYGTYGCYASVGSGAGYTGFKANTYQVAASDAAMTTAQESGLGFSKLTIPQGLQSYSMLFNGATALTLSCQSLADLYSGFSASIGGGAITVPVARSDSSGTTFVFTSYLNLCTAGGARPWPASKVGESGIAWGSSALVAQSGSSGVASYIFSHPGSIGYLGTPVAVTFVTGNVRIAATNNKAGQNYKGNSCSVTGAIPVSVPAATATWSGVNTIYQPGSGVCPMVSFVYIWARQTYPAGTPTATATKAFLNFVYSTAGQNLLPPLNFVKDPSGLITQNTNAVATIS